MTDGQTLADGRYVLSGLLGRGGMAEVHQGLDQRLGRPVAVKQLSAHLAADPTHSTGSAGRRRPPPA
jgi:eukaryotic-like serine/threonine-protein kinase